MHDGVHSELFPVFEAAAADITQVVVGRRVGAHVVGQVGDDEVGLVALLAGEPSAI